MGRSREAARAFVLVLALAGCGKQRQDEPVELTFGRARDTAGLTRGAPLLNQVVPYRMANGAMRVRGTLDFPDGTRVQISIYRSGDDEMVGRLQVTVERGHFDSPPILGATGPLAPGLYRFQFVTYFNDVWQTPEVMRATGGGFRVHGPGVSRDRVGQAAFSLVREARL